MNNNFNDQNQWNNQNQPQNQWNQQQGQGCQQQNPGYYQNNQQQYNNGVYQNPPGNYYNQPVKKKSKAWVFVLVLIVIVTAIAGLLVLGKNKDKEVDEHVVSSTVTDETIEIVEDIETVESTTETEQTQLNEIVDGKIPTPEEFEQMLASLDFEYPHSNSDTATSATMEISYKVFDNEMSATITYESMKETAEDAVVAKHKDTDKHYAYEIIQDEKLDNYSILRVKRTLHSATCEVLDADYWYDERIIDVYIIKNNSVLTYSYATNDANETAVELKSFEKALSAIEYVTLEKDVIIE